MVEFDTYKSCQGCPHRTAEPNCHATCEGYLARCLSASTRSCIWEKV